MSILKTKKKSICTGTIFFAPEALQNLRKLIDGGTDTQDVLQYGGCTSTRQETSSGDDSLKM